MTLNASRSLKHRASCVAIASVVVVAVLGAGSSRAWAGAAAAAEAVVKTPEAAEKHCHDTGPQARETAAPVAAATAVPDGIEAPEAFVDGEPNPFADRFPNVVLKTHEGKTVRFYDDLLAGKIVMINFMYATCKGR